MLSPHVMVELFLLLLGLCVGSFLNVVIYRSIVGLSVARPRRSFCPACGSAIAWYDNLPLLSWLLLRGCCRHCHAPISARYPLVETLTGLSFVLAYHLLFVTGARAGLGPAAWPTDLPLLVSWLCLAAGLVACAAMDIVSYTVDIRITSWITALGIVLHALWAPAGTPGNQPGGAFAAAAIVALIVGGVIAGLSARRAGSVSPREEDTDAASDHFHESYATRVAGLVGTAAFLAIALWLILEAGLPSSAPAAAVEWSIAAALVAIFVVTVLVGGQPRASDAEIHAAIDEEQPLARRTALRELAWLTPAIAAGVLAYAAIALLPPVRQVWHTVVTWSPAYGIAPIGGAVTAISGALVGAIAGWTLRLVFTLIYGREAFGVGDIHILTAAGAAAGGDIALLGLLLSVGIALAGWVAGLALKRTAMIPFGPWLAIGFGVALWWNRPAQQLAENYLRSLSFAWQVRPELLMIAGGLMLVGSAAAIVLSRLVRRWVAPDAR